MNKKFLFFVSMSAILLSSCGLMSGDRELSDEEVNSLMAKISEKSKERVTDFSIEYKETSKYFENDGSLTNMEGTCLASINKSGEFSLSRERKINGKNDISELSIRKLDSTYELVNYEMSNYYDPDNPEIDETVVVKKDNPAYQYQLEMDFYDGLNFQQEVEYMVGDYISGETFSKENIKENVDYYDSNGYSVTASYIGNTNGSITIKVTTQPKNPNEKTEPNDLKIAEETVTFKNYRFTELVSNNTYVNGEARNFRIKMEYQSRVAALPSGWKNKIVAFPSREFPTQQVSAYLSANGVTDEVPTLSYNGACYSNSLDSYGLRVKVIANDVNAVYTSLCNAFPESYDKQAFSFNATTLEILSYKFTSPNQQIEITVGKSSSYVSIEYRANQD